MQASVHDAALVVDLDSKRVSGLYPGVYPITRIDNDVVVFSMDTPSRGNSIAHVLGNVNRITGKTFVFAAEYDRPGHTAFVYDLTCTSARRLF
jgi:hypothetical protein